MTTEPDVQPHPTSCRCPVCLAAVCAYCGCPLTDDLDVNHSRVHDDVTNTDCCCPACAEGVRRLNAGRRLEQAEWQRTRVVFYPPAATVRVYEREEA